MTSNILQTTKEPEQDVILISGYKRSGKDTTAKMLKEIIEESTSQKVEIMSFAEPLKFIAKTIFGISDEQLDEYKNNYRGIYYYDDSNELDILTNFREVLTKIASDALKPIFGDDVWVKIIKEKMLKSNADVIIIPDFRFLVENAFKNSVNIRIVNYDIVNDSSHPSEIELDNFIFDYYLDNTRHRLNKEVIKEDMNNQIDNKKQEKIHG